MNSMKFILARKLQNVQFGKDPTQILEQTAVVREGTCNHQNIHAFLGHFVTNQGFMLFSSVPQTSGNFTWPYIKEKIMYYS